MVPDAILGFLDAPTAGSRIVRSHQVIINEHYLGQRIHYKTLCFASAQSFKLAALYLRNLRAIKCHARIIENRILDK